VRLFEQTDNLATLTTDILESRSGMREIARYLTAPPVSDDDLKTLSGFGSATGPEYLAEMLKVITSSLDPKRFSWLVRPASRDVCKRASSVVSRRVRQSQYTT